MQLFPWLQSNGTPTEIIFFQSNETSIEVSFQSDVKPAEISFQSEETLVGFSFQ